MQIGGLAGLGMGLVGATAPTKPFQGLFASEAPAPTGARAEFLKRAQMSVAEQMRAQMLDALGLTEDDIRAMSPEQQAALEDKIKDMIKTRVEQADEQKNGALLDIKA